jgi:hypothetical protein
MRGRFRRCRGLAVPPPSYNPITHCRRRSSAGMTRSQTTGERRPLVSQPHLDNYNCNITYTATTKMQHQENRDETSNNNSWNISNHFMQHHKIHTLTLQHKPLPCRARRPGAWPRGGSGNRKWRWRRTTHQHWNQGRRSAAHRRRSTPSRVLDLESWRAAAAARRCSAQEGIKRNERKMGGWDRKEAVDIKIFLLAAGRTEPSDGWSAAGCPVQSISVSKMVVEVSPFSKIHNFFYELGWR